MNRGAEASKEPRVPPSTHTMLSRNTLLLLGVAAPLAAAFASVTGSCAAVPRDQCGIDFEHSCLRCGTASSYDCEECCPGCKSVSKSSYKYCDCGSKPGPSPSPTPSPTPGAQWDTYTVAGMDVTSLTGGSTHEKVVIMLHGGGQSGSMWPYYYQQGWFGNISGLKYVFPTSAIASHVWFNTYKNSCGLNDDCAYDIPSIQESATRVATLIEREKALVGGDGSKVYLAGFSEGAQLTGYMQIAKLDFALGGTIIMDGFPLPPLFDMVGSSQAAARANATYYGDDMNWFIWHGESDPIFPIDQTLNTWNGMLDALGARSTLAVEHREPGMTHTVIQSEFTQVVSFIRA
eukprot:2734937-Prymnesium_polylepis.1